MNRTILNRQISTFFKTDTNIQSILLFLYFTVVSLSMIASRYTFVNDLDDWILWSYLTAGEPRIMIMSYPLATGISTLYNNFPQVQWYSITVFFYISLISLLFSFYISWLNDKYLKILSIFIATLILIHVWLQVSVTILTLLLIAVSIPLIRKHQVMFWILVLVASFLRTGIIFSLLPFFALVYILLFEKKYLTLKKFFTILALCSLIILNYISPSFDKEYREWNQYNNARAYFVDLRGSDKKDILSEDEKFLSYIWYANDDGLLTSKKTIDAAGTVSDVAIDKIFATLQSFKKIIHFVWTKERTHKLLIFLILLTFYLIYKEQSYLFKTFYLLFIFGFFVLTIVRDNDRAVFPIILAWGILIFLKLLEKKKIILLKGFLLIAIPILIIDLEVNRILNHQANEKLKNEFIQLVNEDPTMTYEISESFPRELADVGYVLRQSHIFDEMHWINYARDNILFPSWTSRHPYVYYSHDISFNGKNRRYESFYEFLLDKNTGFVGSKITNSKVNKVVLRMYDERYGYSKNCHHSMRLLRTSEHFSVTQLIKECEK